MQPEIDYTRLAAEIAAQLRPLLAAPAQRAAGTLWRSTQCADYLGYTVRSFVDRVSKGDNFPPPVTLPSGKRGGHRWRAADVIAWAAARGRQ